MSSTEATIELAISVLEGVLRSLSTPSELRNAVVQQMFDEVYKGAQYEQVVNRAMSLWDDFKQERENWWKGLSLAALLLEFDKTAADAYQSAFLSCLNTQKGLESATTLLCRYIYCEGEWSDENSYIENAQRLIDNGLMVLLSTNLQGYVSDENKIFFLRVLYRLSLYRWYLAFVWGLECSCEAFLRDKELCDRVKTMILQLPQSTEEIKILSNSLVDCILNGYHQSKEITVQIVSPLDYDFGDPPEEVPILFSM